MNRYFFVGCLALVVGLGLYVHRLQGENYKLSVSNTLFESENRLLKDQLREFEHRPTYDEGLNHGLVRSSGAGYVDGYHAAIAQMNETKAITQAEKPTVIPEKKK